MAGVNDYISAGLNDVKKDPVNMIVGLFAAGIGGMFSLGILMGSVQAGYMNMARKIRKGEPAAIGDVFGLINKDTILIGLAPIGVSIVCSILAGILVAVTKVGILGLPFQLLSVAVSIALCWAVPVYVATQKPFMDCFMGSIEFWKKNPVGHLIALIVFGIVGGIGAIACGVGALVTYPIAVTSILHYYLDNSGNAAAAPAAPAAPAA